MFHPHVSLATVWWGVGGRFQGNLVVRVRKWGLVLGQESVAYDTDMKGHKGNNKQALAYLQAWNRLLAPTSQLSPPQLWEGTQELEKAVLPLTAWLSPVSIFQGVKGRVGRITNNNNNHHHHR